jgi:hypothetical protein
MNVNGQLHDPAALSPGGLICVTLWIVGWVDPRTGLRAVWLYIWGVNSASTGYLTPICSSLKVKNLIS